MQLFAALHRASHARMIPADFWPRVCTPACMHACAALSRPGWPCRDESNDSCGFEHVFVGEIDDGHVKGLHNWVQTMVEEARGNLDYMGFVLPKRAYQDDGDDDVDGDRNLVSVQLGWEVRPGRPRAPPAARAVLCLYVVRMICSTSLACVAVCRHAAGRVGDIRVDRALRPSWGQCNGDSFVLKHMQPSRWPTWLLSWARPYRVEDLFRARAAGSRSGAWRLFIDWPVGRLFIDWPASATALHFKAQLQQRGVRGVCDLLALVDTCVHGCHACAWHAGRGEGREHDVRWDLPRV